MTTPRVAQVTIESFDEHELPSLSMDYSEIQNTPVQLTKETLNSATSSNKLTNGWKEMLQPIEELGTGLNAAHLGLEYHKHQARVRFYVNFAGKKVYLVVADWKALNGWKLMEALYSRVAAKLTGAGTTDNVQLVLSLLNVLGSDDENADQFFDHATGVESKTGVTVKSIIDLRRDEGGAKRRAVTTNKESNENPPKKRKKTTSKVNPPPPLPLLSPPPPLVLVEEEKEQPIQSQSIVLEPVPTVQAPIRSPLPPPSLDKQPDLIEVEEKEEEWELKRDFIELLEMEHQATCKRHEFKIKYIRSQKEDTLFYSLVTFGKLFSNK